MRTIGLALFLISGLGWSAMAADQSPTNELTAQLAKEVQNQGWIAFCARGENGSWDIFLSRPDGSRKRNITNTPDYEEAGPLFSRDGKKLLYRRIAKGTVISHDLWGFQGRLVLADADGKNPIVFGEEGEYTWTSWSPDAKQIASLTKKEIQIIDIATKQVARTLKRQGIYQQLFWSPDGKWFTGTGNHAGRQWCIVRMNAETGELNAVHKFQSCTPDWFPDAKRIIYSSRPPQKSNQGYGWTLLLQSEGDGTHEQLIYGEEGSHVYGGAVSPDGKYVLFTTYPNDGGGPEESGAPIFLMRLSDTPTLEGKSEEMRRMYPNVKGGPALSLQQKGWEPCWTYAEIGADR